MTDPTLPPAPIPLPPRPRRRWGVPLLLLALLGGGGFLAWKFFVSPIESFQAIYLVPKDAIYILETDQPIKSWQKISGSRVWKHLRTQPYFAALTASANSLDSLISDNARLFDAFGARHTLVSAHVYRRGTYDFLFVVDLEKAAKFKFLQDYLTNLGTQGYRITERTYHGTTLTELYDKTSRTTLHIAFVENLLVCSYVHTLVEAAIDQRNEPAIGRDFRYLDITQKLGSKGLGNLYVQYAFLDEYASCYLPAPDEYVTGLSKAMAFTGANLTLDDDGRMTLDGYTNLNDSISPYLKAMLSAGKGKLTAQEVIPQRTAFYFSLAFDHFDEFYDNFYQLLRANKAEYADYQASLAKVEKFLNISIRKNFVDWVGQEVAFVQTQPRGLGQTNEFAVIIRAKDVALAKENLAFVTEQIRRKTPARFKEVTYGEHTINFLAVKGFFRLFLGKFFQKLDKPYYTILGDYVIFSNHPQTLKSLLDDYDAQRTLAKSEPFREFVDKFQSASNVFVYAQTATLHGNLRGFVSAATWARVNANKPYVVCFPQVGFQLTGDGALFDTKMIATYQDPADRPPVPPTDLLATADTTHTTVAVTPPFPLSEGGQGVVLPATDTSAERATDAADDIYLEDLSAPRYEEKYPDGTPKIVAAMRDGFRNGPYREYHPNGEVKVKGRYDNDQRVGKWKYYTADGKLLEKRRYDHGKLAE